MLEFEKKVLISAEEFYMLLQIGGKSSAVIQKNYYYDTEDFSMNKNRKTCRIREENGKYTAAVKSHGLTTRDRSDERLWELMEKPDVMIIAGMPLKLQGSLTTERTVILSNELCEAVLDRNTYLDFTDHELEIEYLSSCEAYAESMLKGFAEVLHQYDRKIDPYEFCSRANTSKSKSERFYERLNSLRKKRWQNDDCSG